MAEMTIVDHVAQRMRGIAGWKPPHLTESEWRMLARTAIDALTEAQRDHQQREATND